MLKRLEAAGLVQRQRSTEDERQVVVSLSPEGRALKRKAGAVPEAIFCATGCELDELIDLKTRLDRLRERLAQSG